MSVPKINAQSETTISVAPAILDLAVKPGETTTAVLTIRNGGGFALPVSVTPKSLLHEDEIIGSADKKAADASRWISLDETEFLLAENEMKKVMLGITVPKDASPGGHYAQISVRGLSLEQSSEVGASIVIPEVAVTLLLTVPGELNTSMVIEDNGNLFPFFLTLNTKLQESFFVTNEGNIHDLITPNFILEKDGIEISKQKLSSRIVLPQTRKEFNEEFQMPTDYGIYKAYIELTYTNGQKTLATDKETIIVAPKLLSIFGVAILTIGSMYVFSHRKNLHEAWRVLTENDT